MISGQLSALPRLPCPGRLQPSTATAGPSSPRAWPDGHREESASFTSDVGLSDTPRGGDPRLWTLRLLQDPTASCLNVSALTIWVQSVEPGYSLVHQCLTLGREVPKSPVHKPNPGSRHRTLWRLLISKCLLASRQDSTSSSHSPTCDWTCPGQHLHLGACLVHSRTSFT